MMKIGGGGGHSLCALAPPSLPLSLQLPERALAQQHLMAERACLVVLLLLLVSLYYYHCWSAPNECAERAKRTQQ